MGIHPLALSWTRRHACLTVSGLTPGRPRPVASRVSLAPATNPWLSIGVRCWSSAASSQIRTHSTSMHRRVEGAKEEEEKRRCPSTCRLRLSHQIPLSMTELLMATKRRLPARGETSQFSYRTTQVMRKQRTDCIDWQKSWICTSCGVQTGAMCRHTRNT